MKKLFFHCALCVCCASLMLGACKERKVSVWDAYDVRYPLPAGSTVPVSRATIYNRYNSDNDRYYTRPYVSYGVCSPESIEEFACD